MALLIIVSSGCDKDKAHVLSFSHNTHVIGNEMDCSDCHGEIKDGLKIPDHEVCATCHGDWIEAEVISKDTCGSCHQGGNLDALYKEQKAPAAQPPYAATSVFIHTDTLAKRCKECHENLMDEKLKQVPKWTHEESVRIREQSHKSGMECAACHKDMDAETPPPNHDQNWTRRHGELGFQPDKACGVCHEEQSCRECHETTMPTSHNNLWRLKTHGIQAAWDRTRCMVCHEDDSCVACHAETRPQSHNAAWKDTHCLQCHPSEATDTGCTFCHEGGVDAHPNPHPAGWRSGHCRGCHNGTPGVPLWQPRQ